MFHPLPSVKVVKIDGQPVMCALCAFLMNFLHLLPLSPSFLSHTLIFLDRFLSFSSLQHLYPFIISISPLGLSSIVMAVLFLSPLTCFVEHGTREEFSTTGSSLTPFDPCSQLSLHALLSLSSSSSSFFFFFSPVHPTLGSDLTNFFLPGKTSIVPNLVYSSVVSDHCTIRQWLFLYEIQTPCIFQRIIRPKLLAFFNLSSDPNSIHFSIKFLPNIR
jgi:hypothetical protein